VFFSSALGVGRKKYVELLSRQKKRLIKTLREQDPDGDLSQINAEELRKLTETFREMAESLPKKDKILIDNSLLQNSEIGRLRYAKKLLEESGVFVEQHPLTKS